MEKRSAPFRDEAAADEDVDGRLEDVELDDDDEDGERV